MKFLEVCLRKSGDSVITSYFQVGLTDSLVYQRPLVESPQKFYLSALQHGTKKYILVV